jgi:hypothetical protein
MSIDLNHYLAQPPDYSESFTRRVVALADHLKARCGATISHSADMNYASSQTIVVMPESGGCQVRCYISSRGPLFAIATFEREGNAWRIAQVECRPCAQLIACVRDTLVEFGLREVPSKYWSLPAPGHATDMDGAPATMFDVLFSELL